MSTLPRFGPLLLAALGLSLGTAVCAADPSDAPAESIYQDTPIYPDALRAKKIPGIVLVAFVVDAKGQPVSIYTPAYTRKEFVAGSVACVRRWSYKPAIKAGQPVATAQAVPFIFTDRNKEYLSAVASDIRSVLAGLDSQFRRAVERETNRPAARLPFNPDFLVWFHLAAGPDGSVAVSLTESSPPAEDEQMLQKFQSLAGLHALPADLVHFLQAYDSIDLGLVGTRFLRDNTPQPAKAASNPVDRPPIPVYQPVSLYPGQLRQRHLQGVVLLDLGINSEGKVDQVLPIAYSDPRFISDTVATAYRMRFQPAVRKGNAVWVDLEVPQGFILTVNGVPELDPNFGDLVAQLRRSVDREARNYAQRVLGADHPFNGPPTSRNDLSWVMLKVDDHEALSSVTPLWPAATPEDAALTERIIANFQNGHLPRDLLISIHRVGGLAISFTRFGFIRDQLQKPSADDRNEAPGSIKGFPNVFAAEPQ